VNEAIVAEGFAAMSAGCLAAAIARAAPRRVDHVRRRRVTPHLPLLLGAAGVGMVLPAPKVLTVPLAILFASQLRRFARRRSATRRRLATDLEVPLLLDLLAAGSAAGLSAVTGLERAVPALRGPLGDELRSAIDAVAMGARWREELVSVGDRLDLPDLRRTVAVVTRTETLGSSLGQATSELASDVRSKRRAAVAERARSAPVKMLFPLVFLILPAFLLLTVVPVLLTTVRSIR
jgi:tight adherence protein C